jgi:hypothetical protein
VSAVLTDNPEKAALEAEVEARSKSIKRNRVFRYSQEKTRKSKQLKKNVRIVESSDEEDDNECFCIECAQSYSMSRAPKKLFQCIKRHKWAHDLCAKFCDFYVCRNCISDDNIDDLVSED